MTMTSQPPPKSPRKRRSGLSILFGIAPGVVAMLGVCSAAAAGAANAVDKPLLPYYAAQTVRYEVSGSSGVAEYVTYQIVNGQQHETNVPLPWSTQFTSPPKLVLVLSAQGAGPSSITCRILIDGNVVSQATSTGEPARTPCSYSG